MRLLWFCYSPRDLLWKPTTVTKLSLKLTQDGQKRAKTGKGDFELVCGWQRELAEFSTRSRNARSGLQDRPFQPLTHSSATNGITTRGKRRDDDWRGASPCKVRKALGRINEKEVCPAEAGRYICPEAPSDCHLNPLENPTFSLTLSLSPGTEVQLDRTGAARAWTHRESYPQIARQVGRIRALSISFGLAAGLPTPYVT